MHMRCSNKAQESDYAYHADRLLLVIAQKAKLASRLKHFSGEPCSTAGINA
jgi:hypothetical protein